jgi:uncharacterized membrane protein (UPF0127 family)
MIGARRLGIATAAVLLVLLPVAACSPPPAAETTPAAVPGERPIDAFARANGLEALGRATVQLGGAELDVVVADTRAARERGLQGVDDVPGGVGMLFVFPPEPGGTPGPRALPGFWMLEALVPLDIVFAADGTVVGVATMQPCPARPCPITHPGVDYDVALEVAAGELARAGVSLGDRLTWSPEVG